MIDLVPVKPDIILYIRLLHERFFVAPSCVLRFASIYVDRPIGRISLYGSVSAVIRSLHEIHPDILAGEIIDWCVPCLPHQKGIFCIRYRFAAECHLEPPWAQFIVHPMVRVGATIGRIPHRHTHLKPPVSEFREHR